ncbi:uncharacterized protein LOC111045203 [Nilaparvata lugens]|uniref:uncharacterized protein LOC111045203 n=1 Tax=Nilaparvata lugens TaxID=108931 RepID=UPI00193E5258|nr:uncharacterized protein LOC111045203 [Nilaparvata lugens]
MFLQPLRLNNVDENVAREIDDCLLKESDKEEIMRKIFWKARLKAKEELNEQLADFQQKRTAGLGMLFGPSDAQLEESINDKGKETKIVETILVPKLEPFLADMESDVVDGRRFTTAAALGTILGKKFGVRGQHFSSLIERCPTFVSKDKSLKSKLIGKSRKVTLMGHHFVAHQYFIVTYCNHCQLIIWGIGPQGYQCSNCHLNIHRHCVKVLDENCPGPMVKKEKGNDRISKFMEKIRPENTRRKPSSLNLGSDRLRRQHEDKDGDTGMLIDNELGSDRLSSSTSGGPRVSGGGGGGERRPDPVREAVEERTGAGARGGDHNDEDQHNQSHHDLTHIAKPKSSAATINRSESYKERIPNKRQLRERRKTSDPNLSKTNNDVDVDNQTLTCHANSGSSSNSSLSTRSLDSPSNSLEAVSGGRGVSGEGGSCPTNGSVGGGVPQWDSDLEAEPDPPDWTRAVPEDVLSNLTAREKKRQEVINELFHTERSHVRGLKVLDQVFYRPMRDQQILPVEQMQLLFANLDEMLTRHGHFNQAMKARRKEAVPTVQRVGDLILNMFDGTEGEVFQRAAATFCARQQIALEALKERRRKDQKLHSFLTDAEGSPLCRRLQLKDIIPTGMLRLTKYPLLFENLAKYTAAEDSEEALAVARAVERSKEILNHVDKAVKEAEDQHRLAEIQRRLDKTPFDKADNPLANEFRNLDLTKHRLIHEGALVWRIASRPKPIDLHVLLLEDVIILLQKQDEKYVLKFYSATQFYSPVIKVSTVLVRTNAVDKTGLFLVNTSQNGAQIYDLVATTAQEKRKWFKHISEAAEAYKQRDGRNRRADAAAAAAAAAQHDLDASEHPDKTKDVDDSTTTPSGADLLSPPRATNGHGHGHDESPSPNSESTPLLPSPSPSPSPAPSHPDTPESIARRMGEICGIRSVDDSTTTPSGADLLSPPRATNGHGHGHDESPSPNSESTPLLPSPSPSPSPAPSHPDTPESIARRMGDSLSPSPSLSRKVAEPLRLTTAESSLIQPSEVLISQRPVLTAEPVLTPLEKLRRKDEAIKQALAEKQQLVADILHVPKDEFDTIAEIAGEPATEKEASELILAAVNQANQLSAMVNEALRVTEEDAVSAGVMTSSSRSRTPTSAGVPAHRLNAIATSLNAQLTQLLSVLVQRDDERERLRRELQRSREQLHALHEQRASQGHDDQLTREPGAASLEACLEATLEEANHTGEETDPASSNNPVSESAIASTTAQEVFVDALSGEAESHLEAAGAAEGETLAPTRTADSAD